MVKEDLLINLKKIALKKFYITMESVLQKSMNILVKP